MVIENKHLTKQQEQAKLAVSGWHLGDTSKKYESFGGVQEPYQPAKATSVEYLMGYISFQLI